MTRTCDDLLSILERCRAMMLDQNAGRPARCPEIATHEVTVQLSGSRKERDTLLCLAHATDQHPTVEEQNVLEYKPLRLTVWHRFEWAPEWSHVQFASRQLGMVVDLSKSGVEIDGVWFPEEPFNEPHKFAARLVNAIGDGQTDAGPVTVPGSLGHFKTKEEAVDAIVTMYPPVSQHLASLESIAQGPEQEGPDEDQEEAVGGAA